ncbi:MAG TPA: NAD(P)-dependent alcohol dehydrogenase [Chloroflexia bacterium]|nr:NAD(P)-dependent alcohol dehydrogenase [Chloroflexia bacterium]
MKAIVWTKYGPPEVLQLQEMEKPTPGDNEVLVKVHAASINPLDYHMVRGPWLARLMTKGYRRPKSPNAGSDFSGRVEAVGKNVTEFQPGDEVFGAKRGALGEYVCALEKYLVLKPANITFEQAAAVPVAAVTALQAVRDKGQIKPGQRVLVNGASGGVGTFTVQIAKAFGADVTAVCSTKNLEMVRSIGANHVVDYTQEDVTRSGQCYDVILDNAGTLSISRRLRALCPGGTCVGVGFHSMGLMLQNLLLGPLVSRMGSKKIRTMLAQLNKDDLTFLKQLLADGKVVPVIDRRYPLSEVPEAFRYAEKRHARGKVIITVEHKDE